MKPARCAAWSVVALRVARLFPGRDKGWRRRVCAENSRQRGVGRRTLELLRANRLIWAIVDAIVRAEIAEGGLYHGGSCRQKGKGEKTTREEWRV